MSLGRRKTKDDVYEFRTGIEKDEKLMRKSPDSLVPQEAARREILENDNARSYMGQVIASARNAFHMTPVTSNAELISRIDEYFELAQLREIPPTMEELTLYCGYDIRVFLDWSSGRRRGWTDLYPTHTTSSIAKSAIQTMHAIDAAMVEGRKIDVTSYIFRSKNYYRMKDKTEVEVVAESKIPQALSPEEVTKRLPEADVIVLNEVDISTDDLLSIE